MMTAGQQYAEGTNALKGDESTQYQRHPKTRMVTRYQGRTTQQVTGREKVPTYKWPQYTNGYENNKGGHSTDPVYWTWLSVLNLIQSGKEETRKDGSYRASTY